jgi:Na+/melibiose symporter-like transporter
MSPKSLNPIERKTYRLHLIYSILEGIVLGVLALNEFVFLKSLKGTDFQLGVLFQFSMLVFLGLIFINEFIRRTKNKAKLLRITAIITRLPLLLLFFFPRSSDTLNSDNIYHLVFLAIFLLYYLASPIIYPTINQFLKNTYRHENFGKLYSHAQSINKIVMLVVTFLYGWWLDVNPGAYTLIFPFVAVIGIASVHLLSKIPYKDKEVVIRRSFMKAVKDSMQRMFDLVKNNKPYMHFELGFMLYGFAFMSTVAVITIYYDEALHLNYSSVAFYKNAYNILAIVLLPFFGKLLGKLDPRKFAVITFGSMLLYILALALTQYFPAYVELWNLKIYFMMLVYILFHGVFAATMSLLWFIGSAYFGKDEDAGNLQSVHLSLTGVRAVFAPLIGIVFYQILGFSWTFGIAIFTLFMAILLMIWSYRRNALEK